MPHLCPSPYIATTLDKVNEHLVFNMYSIFSTKHNPRNFCINMNVTNCQATKFTMKKSMPRTTNCSDCIMFSELILISFLIVCIIYGSINNNLIFSKYTVSWIAPLPTYLFIISVNVVQACMM